MRKTPVNSVGISETDGNCEETGMVMAVTVLAALTVGFLAGLMTFRRASQWCPVCGLTLTCPQLHHPQPANAEPRP
jgi:hypothetical protein